MIAYLVLKPTCANPVIIESGKYSKARPDLVSLFPYAKIEWMILFIVSSTPQELHPLHTTGSTAGCMSIHHRCIRAEC
jgi:hypothetical protein